MKRSVKGYSAIELACALAVSGVVLAMAVPAMARMVEQSMVVATHNDLRGAIAYARNQAVQLATPVALCASADQQSCGSDWRAGWIAFTDRGEAGTRDDSDTVLRAWQPADGAHLSIEPIGMTRELRFSTRGAVLPSGANAGWALQPVTCEPGDPSRREILVGPSGDVRLRRSECT